MVKTYTSQQVADLLNVSSGSIINWERSHKLVAHRTAGGHRRFSAAEVLRFCQLSGLPVPDELSRQCSPTAVVRPVVLAVSQDPSFMAELSDLLPSRAVAELRTSDSALGLGFALGLHPARALLVDCSRPVVAWRDLASLCSRLVPPPHVVGLTRGVPACRPPVEGSAGLRVSSIEGALDEDVASSILELLWPDHTDSSGPWSVELR